MASGTGSKRVCETDFDSNAGKQQAQKKKQYNQIFKSDYCKDFPFIMASDKGPHFAFCKVCRKDFCVSHSGRFDIVKHTKGVGHKENAASAGGSSITAFFKPRSETKVDENNNSLQTNITRAEAMMCHFVAENNLSLATMDKLTALIHETFPDSKIAAGVQCGRHKATAVIEKLSDTFKDSLTDWMKTGPFSVSTDGSNDAEAKQFPIVVRTINRDSGLVQSELLSVPVCSQAATGENILRLIEEEVTGRLIPWSNCLSLGCDNAPVMTGHRKGVYSFIQEQQPHIYLSGCTLHMVHNAGKKAATVLPPVDTVLVDIFYYFNKSSERQRRFKGTQEVYGGDQKKMLKHVCTRWLSIGRCLKRLLDNWDPVKVFFKEEVDQLKKSKSISSYASSKAETIFTFVRSPTNQLYASFLLFAVELMEPFLTEFQSEEPKIHKLRHGIQELYRKILQAFVKPSVMPSTKPVEEIDYESPANQKANPMLDIGEDARVLLESKEGNHLRDTRIAEFFSNVRKYYTTLMDDLKSHLPPTAAPQMCENEFNPELLPFLAQVEIVDVDKQATVYFSTLRHLIKKYSALLPTGCELNQLSAQFSKYQGSDVGKFKGVRLDETWANIEKDDSLAMKELSLVMRGLLVIPHSSAHCERVFSCVRKNKTPQRISLSTKTMESLMVLKNSSMNTVKSLPAVLQDIKQAYAQKLKPTKQ